MSKLCNGRDQLVHPPQAAIYDHHGWAYTHSFAQRPLSSQDPDASAYKLCKGSDS